MDRLKATTSSLGAGQDALAEQVSDLHSHMGVLHDRRLDALEKRP